MKKNLTLNQIDRKQNIEKLLLELRAYLIDESLKNENPKLNILSMEMEARKVRNTVFPGRMFGEASWDMLLDLYYSYINGKTITVSSVCIASAVPPTTALRHLQIIQDQGYINRYKDLSDARKTIIQLTEKCLKLMEAWIAKVESKLIINMI